MSGPLLKMYKGLYVSLEIHVWTLPHEENGPFGSNCSYSPEKYSFLVPTHLVMLVANLKKDFLATSPFVCGATKLTR